jgi:hypothetical protein
MLPREPKPPGLRSEFSRRDSLVDPLPDICQDIAQGNARGLQFSS